MNVIKWAVDRFFFSDSYKSRYLKVYFTPPEDDQNDLAYYSEILKKIKKGFVHCHSDCGNNLVSIFEIGKNDDANKEAEEICRELFLETDMKVKITNWKEVLLD